jgi:hypothetical protein
MCAGQTDTDNAQGAHQLEKEIRRLALTGRDCEKLIPDGSPVQAARVSRLREDLAALDNDTFEAEAKLRLYSLLLGRTRCACVLRASRKTTLLLRPQMSKEAVSMALRGLSGVLGAARLRPPRMKPATLRHADSTQRLP